MIAQPLPFPVEPTPEPPGRRVQGRAQANYAPAADSPTRRRRTIWLAVHLPEWPLCAALSALNATERATLAAPPLVIVEDDRRGTIAACNDAAASLGIRPGHSLNACIALCAETQFLPRHHARERELLDELAHLAQRYTSRVSTQPSNELLLEIRGSIRLFGGLTPLITRIQSDLQARGLRSQVAVSATAQSALWLARAAREPRVIVPRDLLTNLSRLPIATLQWPPEIELRLARFGALVIGDLMRLPRGGLARRIGYNRLAELDRAVGRQPEVRRDFPAPERYEDRVLLDFEVETTGLLSVIIERRLQRLQKFLSRRALAIDELHIDLQHRDQVITPLTIGLADATGDVNHVAQLLREQLTRVQLRAPVGSLLIRASNLHRAPGASGDLFLAKGQTLDTYANQARLLERLKSRLGAGAIRRVHARRDHRPEVSQSTASTLVGTAPNSAVRITAPRPLWLLPQPRKIRSISSLARHDLTGPEKIESGWWDDHLVCREYFRARSPAGALGWIYRDRTDQGTWHLHGLFG